MKYLIALLGITLIVALWVYALVPKAPADPAPAATSSIENVAPEVAPPVIAPEPTAEPAVDSEPPAAQPQPVYPQRPRILRRWR
jgi:hypothetical protein